MNDDYRHFPVLKDKIIEIISQEKDKLLNFQKEVVFIDCTLGLAGHFFSIFPILEMATFFLIDCDFDSIQIAKSKIYSYFNTSDLSRVYIINHRFGDFLCNGFNSYRKKFEQTDFLITLADLGISYYQIKNKKGFSFNINSFLDMRYSGEGTTVYEILNFFEEKKLIEIIDRVLEDLNLSKRICGAIVKARERRSLNTTFDLNQAISKVVSAKSMKDILQKVYLALRIYVNQELEQLSKLLQFFNNYRKDFLLLIISYHSLEGRMIKGFLKQTGLSFEKYKPTKDEIMINKPSRSAILWVIKNYPS
ncbi:MAG: 16S rRNA (cytosine(1402)-N(4))-methyltransferase [bacterium]